MYNEQVVLNHWINSNDITLLKSKQIDRTYFFSLRDIYDWVEQYVAETGTLPSSKRMTVEFEDFKVLTDLDPLSYAVVKLTEAKAYVEYRPILTANAKLVNEGGTLEALQHMKSNVDSMLKKYTSKLSEYSWIKEAQARYEKYMEKHGKDGLPGITTGLPGLDELTGGWKDDDMILISGRLNEGKSLVGLFFCFKAWMAFNKAGITDPVVYVSTEMPELEVAYRLDTMKAHFSNRALNEGKLGDSELYKEYTDELITKTCDFVILTNESNGGKQFSPTDIKTIIETKKPSFLCVDQLYDLVDDSGERDIRRKIVNITTSLRDVNLNTKTPVILIAQAGRSAAKSARKGNNITPELDEIQESDNPAQKATRVITLRLIDNNFFVLSLKKNRGGKKNQDIFVEADIDNGLWEETVQEAEAF